MARWTGEKRHSRQKEQQRPGDRRELGASGSLKGGRYGYDVAEFTLHRSAGVKSQSAKGTHMSPNSPLKLL